MNSNKNTLKFRLLILLGVFLVIGFNPTFAQEEDIEELEEFFVSDVPIEESILPTTRPFNSVYGTGRSIMETPRNVTIISREQLDAIAIYDVRDFVKLTASSFTKSNFGAPSNPSIRTQTADTFVNGMRRGLTSNGNGLPVNFNAVESVNIVKGGPTAIYGASQYTGGYADQITKKPYFDAPHGSASVTIGMYDQLRWTIDYGRPINDELAIRFSYSGEESGSYYEFGKRESQALYGALTWKPGNKYRLEFNFEYFQASYTENWGTNRITQDLIDNGMYLPGQISEVGDRIGFPGDSFFVPDSMDRNADGVVNLFDIRGSGNFINFGAPVKISRSKRLLAPGDDSFGRQFTAQAIQTLEISDRFSISNNTSYNWIDRDTFSSYGYSEVLIDNVAIDNRTEIRVNLADSDRFAMNINGGLHFRWQNVLAMNHYFIEPANVHDLTVPVPTLEEALAGGSITRRIPDEAFGFIDRAIPGERVRGILSGRYANPGFNGDTGDSQATRFGPFIQLDMQFGGKLNFFGGYRRDYMDVRFIEPIFFGFEATTKQEMENYNVSLLYRFNNKMSTYVTYNFSESAAAGTGGGFVPSDYDDELPDRDPIGVTGPEDGDGMGFQADDFHNENFLYETGMKFSLKEDTLFISTAIFYQEFANPSINALGQPSGTFDRTRLRGFEIEANYQPNKSFYMTTGYSYIDATIASGAFSVAPRSIEFQQFTDSFGITLQRIELNGAPDHLFNALVHYQMDNGVFINSGIFITSPFNTGFHGACLEFAFVPVDCISPVVPWQYTLDLALGYKTDSWEVKLDFFNLTDQKNWSPPHRVYGTESLLPELPLRLELTFKYLW